uniref:F-box domain-containing protein n=1 Tax=Chenopodium quinoa TaxID=63459 RepID=A0A803L8E1_CHEQI
MIRRKSSWSDLPSELLSAIARRLETRTDLCKFRAVCSKWRRSAPNSLLLHKNLLSPLLPHKISTLTPPLLDKNRSSHMSSEIPGKSLITVPCSVFLLRPSRNLKASPWLITVEELNPGKFYLRKPLSRINIKYLPENFPKVLQLSDLKVIELGKFCTLRLNNEEEKYLNTKGRNFDDILNFNGRVYAIDLRGRLYRTGYDLLSMLEIVGEPIGLTTDKKKCLVELLGELYVVVYRCQRSGNRSPISFEVYRLQEEEEEWEMVEDICDRILFVTLDGCFFANKNYFPGCRGNSIVYYKKTFPQYTGATGSFDIGIFHFDDGRVINVYGWPIAPSPRYSEVFWPPPAWLLPDTESATNGYPGGVNQYPLVAVQVVTLPSFIQVADHAKPIDTTFTEIVQNGVSQAKFQGIKVSSHLVPILKKIWDKHGNIMQGHVLQTNDQLTWALESLANGIRFRLDWLIPFVQKAMAVHNEQQQVHYVQGLEMSKSNLLAQLHDLDCRLAQQRNLLAGMAVASAPLAHIDLKNVLG